MAATGKVIGTVTAVVGEAKATAADGTVRILQVGDVVHGDEVITTSAAGSINVALESGKTLDCGGDIELSLHESVLNVATAAEPPAGATAFDVDAIQRAITAGQDPSQVAAATAAGGAPAAGGSDLDGGAHEPVILEQGNAASVVTSGFATEGETATIATLDIDALPGLPVVASVPAPVGPSTEPAAPSIQQAPVFENTTPQGGAVANDQAAAPVIAAAVVETSASDNSVPSSTAAPVVAETNAPLPAEAPAVVAADTGAQQEQAQESQAPVVVTPSQEPIIVAENAPEQPAQDAQPPVVVTPPSSEPVIVAEDTPAPADEPVIVADSGTPEQPSQDPVIVAEEPSTPSEEPVIVVDTNTDEPVAENNQPPVITEPQGDPVVVVNDPTPEVPEPTLPVSASLTYSISANTNQDEQLALLTFENDGHTFQSLLFFGQEGQQKPSAVPLDFAINHGVASTVTLQYVDAFAGNSDANTGHTAQKIAIKDFALSIDGVQAVLAQENDGVNIGVGKSITLEASVQLDTATGSAGEWSFAPAAAEGANILNVTTDTLDLGNVGNLQAQSLEVINLKGSDAQELTLTPADVLNMTGSDMLHIIGGKEDTLNLAGSGWTDSDGNAISNQASYQASYFGWVEVKNGATTLLIDPDVHINPMG